MQKHFLSLLLAGIFLYSSPTRIAVAAAPAAVSASPAKAPPPESDYDGETTEITVREALRDAMGINHFNASFWFGDMEHDKVLRSMRLFAEEVMPRFKD